MESEPGSDWTEEQAEDVFFKRLARQESQDRERGREGENNFLPAPAGFPCFPVNQRGDMYGCCTPPEYCCSSLLSSTHTGLGYIAEQIVPRSCASEPSTQDKVSLESRISDAGRDLQIARTQIEARDKAIADLRRQLAQRASEFAALKASQAVLESDLKSSERNRQELAQQRTEIVHKLDGARSDSQLLQQKLDSLAHSRLRTPRAPRPWSPKSMG